MLKKQIEYSYTFFLQSVQNINKTPKLGNKYIFADTYTFDATRDSNPRP